VSAAAVVDARDKICRTLRRRILGFLRVVELVIFALRDLDRPGKYELRGKRVEGVKTHKVRYWIGRALDGSIELRLLLTLFMLMDELVR
jgi:hypothetical protein